MIKMQHIRFRRISEIQYREYRKIGGYFDRKHRKQGFKMWKRARRLELTELEFYQFYRRIVGAGSRGVSYREMKMNSKALDKYFNNLKEEQGR